jgi:hypothetical protein
MDYNILKTIYQQIDSQWNTLYPIFPIRYDTLQTSPPQDLVEVYYGATCISSHHGDNLIKVVKMAEVDVKKYLATNGIANMSAPGC